MRIALGLEYNGANYFGWQRQREVDSVQARVEAALSKIADHQVTVFCAGRTDAGVHATGQVIHFDTHSERDAKAWTLGVNANLPRDIAVKWVKWVDELFHARYTATARRYRYIIYNHHTRPAILAVGLSHYPLKLDAEKMHQASQCLLGEQDFSAFRAVHCQAKTAVRFIHYVQVKRQGHYIIVDIKANAFLHHMVRNIVGSLIEIGAGEQPVSWMSVLLRSKDRTIAGPTAKAGGLYMVEVTYPPKCAMPVSDIGPLFLV